MPRPQWIKWPRQCPKCGTRFPHLTHLECPKVNRFTGTLFKVVCRLTRRHRHFYCDRCGNTWVTF